MMNLAALIALLEGERENFITASTPGGIRAQERAGQISFVATDTLPIRCNGCTREQLEAMGIQFGEPADDLFVNVRLPDGWSKSATGHAMWSKLLDEQGRERATIFYKAAFYDRDAFIGLSRRYSGHTAPISGYDSPDYDYDTTPIRGIVTDCDVIIWQTENTLTRPVGSDREAMRVFYGAQDALVIAAREWLTENYPDWQDPLAYWD